MSIPFKELDAHFKKRKVPKSQNGRLLLASWNIANLGATWSFSVVVVAFRRLLRTRWDASPAREILTSSKPPASRGIQGPT